MKRTYNEIYEYMTGIVSQCKSEYDLAEKAYLHFNPDETLEGLAHFCHPLNQYNEVSHTVYYREIEKFLRSRASEFQEKGPLALAEEAAVLFHLEGELSCCYWESDLYNLACYVYDEVFPD